MRYLNRKENVYGYLVKNVGINQSSIGWCVDRLIATSPRSATRTSGSRNNRVRHFSRRFGGNSDTCHHGISTEASGALECNRRWYQRFVRAFLPEQGQATIEFAVIAAGFLSLTVALMALWRVLGDGLLVQHALAVASHHIQSVAPVTIVDIFLY